MSAREERAASLLALFKRDPAQYAKSLPTLLPRIPEFDFPTVDGIKLNSPAAVEKLAGSRGTPAAPTTEGSDAAPDSELAAAFGRIRRRREAEAAPPVPAPSVLDEPPPPPDDDIPPPPPLSGVPSDDGLMRSFMKAAGMGPPKTEAEAAAERTAAEFASANRAAAAKSAFERVAAEKAAADKVFAERAVAAEKVAAERAAADRVRAERDRAERAEREMQLASKTMRAG